MAMIRCAEKQVALICQDSIVIFDDCNKDGVKTELKITTDSEREVQGEDDEVAEGSHVTSANFSPCCGFFAVTTVAKELLIWNHQNDCSWSFLSKQPLARRAVQVQFTKQGSKVLVADRSGDVYSFPLAQETPGTLLMGRLSMLLDMTLSLDNKFLIVSDRDEKIQVSRYPNCYNIHSFCLGHTQFVTCLSLLPKFHDLIVSGSGDGSIFIWDYKSGNSVNCVDCVTIMAEDQHLKSALVNNSNCPAVMKIVSCFICSIFVVLFDRVKTAFVFSVSSDNNMVSCKLVQKLYLPSEPLDACFQPTGSLIVLLAQEDMVQPYSVKDGILYQDEVPDQRLLEEGQKKWNVYGESLNYQDLYKGLYKQWFDNIQVYLEKKRKREEEQIQRKKKCQ